MPMIWNTEAEAKLLSKIFTICDVKVGAEQLKELAAEMGPDCTPKAITHRISKFRNASKPANEQGGGNARSPKPKTLSKSKSTKPAPAASKTGRARAGKKTTPSPSPSGDEEESAGRPKRSTPKRNYAQMAGQDTDAEDDGHDGEVSKYIKTEEEGDEDLREAPTEGIEFDFA